MVKRLLMLMATVMVAVGAMGQEKSYDLCLYKDGAVIYNTAVSGVDSIAFVESDSATRVNERLLEGVWYGCGREYWYDDTNRKFVAEEEQYTKEFRTDGKVYTVDKWRADTTKYRMEGAKLIIGGSDYTIESISGDTLKYGYVQMDTKTKIVIVLSHKKPQTDAYSDEPEYVDLGLPSGTLWATHNVGAKRSDGIGYYFLWGEYTYYSGNSSLSGWLLDGMSYDDLMGMGYLDENGNLTGSADYVKYLEGEEWVMPTKEEFDELLALPHTDFVRNGMLGCLFFGKNGNTLFLPSAGSINNGKLALRTLAAMYWTSTAYKEVEGKAYAANFLDNYSMTSANLGTVFMPIRAVRAEKTEGKKVFAKAIDLGLPSGTIWADRNIGASEYGGEGTAFNWNDWCGFDNDKDALMNGAIDANGNITEAYDIATANWGDDWRMPTKEELEELKSLWYKGDCEDRGGFLEGENGETLYLPYGKIKYVTSHREVYWFDKYRHYEEEDSHREGYWEWRCSVLSNPKCEGDFYVRPVLKKK